MLNPESRPRYLKARADPEAVAKAADHIAGWWRGGSCQQVACKADICADRAQWTNALYNTSSGTLEPAAWAPIPSSTAQLCDHVQITLFTPRVPRM